VQSELRSFYCWLDTPDRACTYYSDYYCITTFLGKCCGSIVLYIAIFSFEGMQDVNRGLSCGDMGIVQLASRVPFSFGRGRDEGLAFLVSICYLLSEALEN
jgi:hypothetical protein